MTAGCYIQDGQNAKSKYAARGKGVVENTPAVTIFMLVLRDRNGIQGPVENIHDIAGLLMIFVPVLAKAS